MDIDKLIERLYKHHTDWGEGRTQDFFKVCLDCKEAATALSTLQAENAQLRGELEYEQEHANAYHEECGQWEAENEKLRAELEQAKRLYESEKEDFIDFACSGVPNLTPYCLNRHPDCVDERGWCRTEKCRGFSRERGQKED
jgi:predicted nuclease with TOPRIM domain